MPNGVGDPNVSGSAADIQSIIDYVAASGCDFTPGETIKRNSCSNPWSYDLDMRLSQEIPGIGSLTGLVEDKLEFFVDLDNVLNLIDDKGNRVIFRNSLVDVADVSVGANGVYNVSDFRPNDRENISTSASAWRLQVGVRYEF